MPEEWASGAAGLSDGERARLAADYIAGMTDRFAIAEHRRIFDEAPELR
jgi:dGTPase